MKPGDLLSFGPDILDTTTGSLTRNSEVVLLGERRLAKLLRGWHCG
jgi:DNA-binding winged helix-turn-helix (wHTH) protein